MRVHTVNQLNHKLLPKNTIKAISDVLEHPYLMLKYPFIYSRLLPSTAQSGLQSPNDTTRFPNKKGQNGLSNSSFSQHITGHQTAADVNCRRSVVGKVVILITAITRNQNTKRAIAIQLNFPPKLVSFHCK